MLHCVHGVKLICEINKKVCPVPPETVHLGQSLGFVLNVPPPSLHPVLNILYIRDVKFEVKTVVNMCCLYKSRT